MNDHSTLRGGIPAPGDADAGLYAGEGCVPGGGAGTGPLGCRAAESGEGMRTRRPLRVTGSTPLCSSRMSRCASAVRAASASTYPGLLLPPPRPPRAPGRSRPRAPGADSDKGDSEESDSEESDSEESDSEESDSEDSDSD